MSIAHRDGTYGASRRRRTYVVRCDEEDCWEAVTGGVTGLPLPGVREGRRVAAVKGWLVAPTQGADDKDYCPYHRADHEEE